MRTPRYHGVVTAPETGERRPPGTVAASCPIAAETRRGDRSIAYGGAAAIAGGVLLFVLAGPLSVDTGLLVATAAVGWIVGLAARAGATRARAVGGPAARMGTAVTLAIAACVVAWIATWGWSHVQGGVLGPVDFLAQVYGLLVPAQALFGAAGAAIGSR